MGAELSQPTSSETLLAQRRLMVHLTEQGWSHQAIAEHLGVSRRTVLRWVGRYRAAGPVGLAYRPRRPRTPHPQTTPATVRARIRAIREAHPRWGARLIRRQLAREGVTPLPTEVTIQHWLAHFGFDLVQPRTGKPLGWPAPPPVPSEEVWQADFTEKGGPPTSASWPAAARRRVCWSRRCPPR